MIKYKNYLEEKLLNESLDSPVDYDLTEDTQSNLKRVYATFVLDDVTYGMSLEESNHDGIYLLKFYRIVNSKARHWSFRKPNHVRKGLSTLLTFVNDLMPKIKHRVDGIITRIPKNRNSERVVELSDKIIRRSFITSFRSVPIRKTEEAKYNYLFILRKQLNPLSVFKSKKFSGYDFDPDEQVLPTNVADEIMPKKRERRSFSIAPARGLGLDKLKIQQVEIDDEIIDQIEQVRNVEKKHRKPPKSKVIDFGDFTNKDFKTNLEKMREAIPGLDEIENPFISNEKEKVALLVTIAENSDKREELDYLMNNLLKTDVHDEKINILNSWFKLLKEEAAIQLTYNDITQDILGKLISGFTNIELHIEDFIIKSEQFSDAYEGVVFNKSLYEKMKAGEGKYGSIKKTYENLLRMAENLELQDNYSKLDMKKIDIPNTTTFISNIDPETLESSVPGTGTFDYSMFDNPIDHKVASTGLKEKNENKTAKALYILSDLGYNETTDYLDENQKGVLHFYTDIGYKQINRSLRKSAKEFFLENIGEFDNTTFVYLKNQVKDMNDMFKQVHPLKEPIWVYRDSDAPDNVVDGLFEGRDYIDPACLSTTYGSDINFHSNASLRFRIYIPRGSKILVPGNLSEFSGELEIILPPFSVLTTLRIDTIEIPSPHSFTRSLVTSIYAGSAYDDFREQIESAGLLKEQSLSYNLKENKEKDEDHNDKFSDSVDDEIGPKLQELLKNKKLKVTKPNDYTK